MKIQTKVPRWYSYKDGIVSPCYELPKRDNSGMKAYTLREARELKLLPSVTSVLSVIDKPELDNWRVEQAIKAALTLPRDFLGESEDSFAQRVLADAEAQANKAAEFGTRIHDAIATIMSGFSLAFSGPRIPASIDKELWPYLMSFAEWATGNIEEVHAVEKCVGHPSIGVAGRMDLDCTLKGYGRSTVDFKTQNVRDGKAQFWKDWPIQLCAYSWSSFLEDKITRKLVSVVIPSNEPGPVHVKEWGLTAEYADLFEAALTLWIYTRGNGYDPRQQ